MGNLLFWRKNEETGEYRPDGTAQSKVTEVSRDEPLPVQIIQPDDNDYPPVRIPEESGQLPPIAGQTITRVVQVPGVGTGAAYTAGEAFGTPITFQDVFRAAKCSGTITNVFLLDLDDEGIQVDVPIFIAPIAGTADNSAFAPTDIELLTCRAVLPITAFYNWSVNQFGQYTGTPVWVKGQDTNLYTQLVVQGAANIAAGAIPRIGITVVPD